MYNEVLVGVKVPIFLKMVESMSSPQHIRQVIQAEHVLYLCSVLRQKVFLTVEIPRVIDHNRCLMIEKSGVIAVSSSSQVEWDHLHL